MAVVTGLGHLQAERFASLKGKRVGLMSNPSAVDHNLNSAYQIFTQDPAVDLRVLFAPEHGFAGAAPDAARIASNSDARTGLPVFSLYGETYKPTPEILREIDLLVCDIQDVGLRFYTFVWTVSHILAAAGESGVEVLLLDRPNPLGGLKIDGPSLEAEFASFVGRHPVPVQHGLTLGEMARLINATWNPTPCELSVLPCQGWQRAMTWDQSGLPWVPPSPNLPHYVSLQHYPGTCLIEGTTLSEGRGTSLPFEIVGAPWIDGMDLADHLNAQPWTADFGARFRPHTFLPETSKWRGTYCQGVQAYIADPVRWDALRLWLYTIVSIRALYPTEFAWLPPQSAGVEAGSVHHFDRLVGSDSLRQQIESDAPLDRLTQGWDAVRRDFATLCQPFLLYE